MRKRSAQRLRFAIRQRSTDQNYERLRRFQSRYVAAKGSTRGHAILFPGSAYSRLEAYQGIIADAKAAAPDKAYALYRAINCYAPSKVNACGGPGVAVAQRKAWFQNLKTAYPRSNWAQTLDFYW